MLEVKILSYLQKKQPCKPENTTHSADNVPSCCQQKEKAHTHSRAAPTKSNIQSFITSWRLCEKLLSASTINFNSWHNENFWTLSHTRTHPYHNFLPHSFIPSVIPLQPNIFQDTPCVHYCLLAPSPPSPTLLSSSSLPSSVLPALTAPLLPMSLCQFIKLDLSHSAKRKLNPGPWTPSVASALQIFFHTCTCAHTLTHL